MSQHTHTQGLVELCHVSRSFGQVKALSNVTLTIRRGECLGLIGHNGAGKSTLMNILAGTLALDEGDMTFAGQPLGQDYAVNQARALGVRCVFQELSLCPNLSVLENTHIACPEIRGWQWRKQAAAQMTSSLDQIFPGHGIKPQHIVADLSIGQRQMVEIARAFTAVDRPVELVILDEPTSSLDARVAQQLLSFVRRFVEGGGSLVLISHILDEMLSSCDRIAVMQDGHVVEVRQATDYTRDSLVEAMGHAASPTHTQSDVRSNESSVADPTASESMTSGASNAPLRVHQASGPAAHTPVIEARQGQIIGLAGLAGHGQSAFLNKVLMSRQGAGQVAFVAGDRQTEGIFPLWSIAENMAITSLKGLSQYGLIERQKVMAMANQWQHEMGIRTPSVQNPMGSLSGGNQQKVLFARALGASADLILMDDPMRGVDVGTKREVYERIQAEAAKGRTFIWYTTEFEELSYCDHIYVFRDGQAVEGFPLSELSEARVLSSSFEEDVVC
ncbi:ABC transporter ATP-binding protein [Terasakiispira papahanaumokuakeensis]|uniref:ABC transporter ATP-binding protein n=1 Tax=Terasakiispira papahanaumokuakeensis TaxID=197479 RepID=A0A1E2V5F6_9GAMM|nr:sugar ABC transporter ATP-binding protein [Terasakiispira papahanaumokuakeensis]ODC02224.1 ABC transporter ATP-binding protein [Terasakiispira papahanaumokuakeensis]